ncbi:hypothetical protein PN836_004850 [Ningiella sp. W23]|uniref:hypothetical protein n=1 Tax=Ningiella sp. W23 TaxID=3023715 RepID=UPI0037576C93
MSAAYLWSHSTQTEDLKPHLEQPSSSAREVDVLPAADALKKAVVERTQLAHQASISAQQLFEVSFAADTYGCAQRLQFVASSRDSLHQATQFKSQFEADARFNGLDICLNEVALVHEEDLSCNNKTSQGAYLQRINCTLDSFVQVTNAPHFTHLVVFAAQGKAYVQRGVMYLDEQDSYSVFIHELAHFANFVDEYALNPALARQFCHQSSSASPNLILSSEKLSGLNGNYESSSTCASLGIKSYKPSAKLTFMEFHDVAYIPDNYLQMWELELSRQHGQIAFAHQMLYLANKKGNQSLIAHWQAIADGT